MIEAHIQELGNYCSRKGYNMPVVERLSNGGTLISIDNVEIGAAWNRPNVKILFVAPPSYPAAQPDCFWVEPNGFRLAGGGTPKATNDSNPIPGDTLAGRKTTWFSWHVQSWNPSIDTLRIYFEVILDRFEQAQ